MILNAALLNTQYYKVRIKSKVEQSREWSSALPLHLGVVAIEKGAFESPSTTVANFTYIIKNIMNVENIVCQIFGCVCVCMSELS